MRPLRILLADLAYTHQTEYIHPIPLNVGYIAAYALERHPEIKIEIIKHPEAFLEKVLVAHQYDVVAVSNYDWNVNLDKHFLNLLKLNNPQLVTVMGGPNVNADSGEWMTDFFSKTPALDVYITGEGEERFSRLLEALKEAQGFMPNVWEYLPNTVFGFDRISNQIIRGTQPDVAKCDCSKIPSPYLMGLLDSFLDDPNLVPIIETNRGCPYACAYCCWGNSTSSKIRKFPLETVLAEIAYIARRTKNPMKSLYIADANFGIFKRDVEIATILKETSQSVGYPSNVYLYFAKNTDEKVIEVARQLRGLTDITMSKQTLNKEALRIIKRDNISDDRYEAAYSKLQEEGASSYCEMIYSLPGETYESFMNGLEDVAQRGFNPVLYPLLTIRGTEIDTEIVRARHNIKTAFRMIPRYTGTFGSVNSVEYEEVVVEHDLFTRDDFFKIRTVQFLYWVFKDVIFNDLRRHLVENGTNVIAFIRSLLNDRKDWPNGMTVLLEGFEVDARNEFLTKEETLREFTAEEIAAIRQRGLALNIWHFCRLLDDENMKRAMESYLSSYLAHYYHDRNINVPEEEASALLSMCFDRIVNFSSLATSQVHSYGYDLASWQEGHKTRLDNAKTIAPIAYHFQYPVDLLLMYKEKLVEHADSLQALYYHRMSFVNTTPYRAYTYERIQDGMKVIAEVDHTLMRDIPQLVRAN